MVSCQSIALSAREMMHQGLTFVCLFARAVCILCSSRTEDLYRCGCVESSLFSSTPFCFASTQAKVLPAVVCVYSTGSEMVGWGPTLSGCQRMPLDFARCH